MTKLGSGRNSPVPIEEAGRGMSRGSTGEPARGMSRSRQFREGMWGAAVAFDGQLGWCQASGAREGERLGRVPARALSILEMVQDPTDHAGLNEGDDAHPATAVFANQRVGFEHTTDKISPLFAEGFPLGGMGVLDARGWSVSRIFSSSSGVVPVVQAMYRNT